MFLKYFETQKKKTSEKYTRVKKILLKEILTCPMMKYPQDQKSDGGSMKHVQRTRPTQHRQRLFGGKSALLKPIYFKSKWPLDRNSTNQNQSAATGSILDFE